MAGFVDTTVRDIEGRLSELKQEVDRLEAARAALLGDGGSRRRTARASAPSAAAAAPAAPAPSRARRGSARKPGRPRGRRAGNTRANQALEIVRARPGVTIPDMATEMKIEPNYLYRVMPKLVSDGLVVKDGTGWRPAPGGDS